MTGTIKFDEESKRRITELQRKLGLKGVEGVLRIALNLLEVSVKARDEGIETFLGEGEDAQRIRLPPIESDESPDTPPGKVVDIKDWLT